MRISCGLNLHLDASATMCLVNRGGLGKAKHVDVQNLWIQEAFKSGRFVTKKIGTNVNPADLVTKTAGKAEDRAAHEYHGLRIHGSWSRRVCEPEVVKMAGERVTSMLVVALTSASASSRRQCRVL